MWYIDTTVVLYSSYLFCSGDGVKCEVSNGCDDGMENEWRVDGGGWATSSTTSIYLLFMLKAKLTEIQ